MQGVIFVNLFGNVGLFACAVYMMESVSFVLSVSQFISLTILFKVPGKNGSRTIRWLRRGFRVNDSYAGELLLRHGDSGYGRSDWISYVFNEMVFAVEWVQNVPSIYDSTIAAAHPFSRIENHSLYNGNVHIGTHLYRLLHCQEWTFVYFLFVRFSWSIGPCHTIWCSEIWPKPNQYLKFGRYRQELILSNNMCAPCRLINVS